MSEEIKSGELYCCRCNVKLENIKTEFEYLANSFHHDVPRCPICGQVHIPDDIVFGKLLILEQQLEEK